MLKIVIIVSNNIELKAKSPNLIQFYPIIPKLDITSLQMCTLSMTLKALTNARILFGMEEKKKKNGAIWVERGYS